MDTCVVVTSDGVVVTADEARRAVMREMGRRGGIARAARMTPDERAARMTEISQIAARSRSIRAEKKNLEKKCAAVFTS